MRCGTSVGRVPAWTYVLDEHDICRTRDLAADDRWPTFRTKAVRQTGVRSMMCFRLFMQDDLIAIGVILAGHGSLALAAAARDVVTWVVRNGALPTK